MKFSISFDDKDLQKGLNALQNKLALVELTALGLMADTLLTLSAKEVPHDEGTLQSSGHTEKHGNEYWVVYNTKYASYQHEGIRADGTHAILHYQKGRKKKYLQDPLLNNMSIWQKLAQEELAKILK